MTGEIEEVPRLPAASRMRLPRGAVPWLLLTPAIALSMLLIVAPYVMSLVYAFTGATLFNITHVHFVGLRNFHGLVHLSEPRLSLEIVTTIAFTAGTVIGCMLIGTILAVALYTIKPR